MRKKHEKISPFTIVKKGYEPDEVDERLAELQSVFESDTDELVRSVATLELELEAAREREEAVSLTLVAATRTKEEILEGATKLEEEARATADKIMAEARYEAFQLVTDARKQGDEILASARKDAGGMSDNGSGPNGMGLGDTSFATGDEAEARARVAKLRAAAASLEDRLRSFTAELAPEVAGVEALLSMSNGSGHAERLADFDVPSQGPSPSALASRISLEESPTAPPVAPVEAQVPEVADGEVPLLGLGDPTPDDETVDAPPAPEPPVLLETDPVVTSGDIDEAEPTVLSAEAEVIDHSVASQEAPDIAQSFDEPDEMAPTASLTDRPRFDDDESGDTDVVVPERGSFYSRRSARLPRIGQEAGKGALAAMSGLRGQLTSDDSDDEDVQDDVVVQTI